MTKRNSVLFIGSLAIMIFLLGFCVGCGNSLTGDSITISDLSPASITLQHSSGIATVTLMFNATGFSQNPTVYWALLNNAGQIIQGTSTVLVASSPSLITVSFSVDTSLLAAGSSGSYRVYMSDDTGGVSNVLFGSWTAA